MTGALSNFFGLGIFKHGAASHVASGVTPGDYPAFSCIRVQADGTITLAELAWDTRLTYAANQWALGSDSKLYRSTISTQGVNPVGDLTGTWVRVYLPASPETPTGAINGINVTFGISQTPAAGTLMLYLNGILQKPTGQYTLAGTVITMAAAPLAGDWLQAVYLV